MKNKIGKFLGRRRPAELAKFVNRVARENPHLKLPHTRQAVYFWVANQSQPNGAGMTVVALFLKKRVSQIFYIPENE